MNWRTSEVRSGRRLCCWTPVTSWSPTCVRVPLFTAEGNSFCQAPPFKLNTDWFRSQPFRSWNFTGTSNHWRTRFLSSRNPMQIIPEVMRWLQWIQKEKKILNALIPLLLSDLELRLNQSKAQLQDSQSQLQEVDKENYNLSMRRSFFFLLIPFFLYIFSPAGGWRVMLMSFFFNICQSQRSLFWEKNWRPSRKLKTQLKLKESRVGQRFFLFIWRRKKSSEKEKCLFFFPHFRSGTNHWDTEQRKQEAGKYKQRSDLSSAHHKNTLQKKKLLIDSWHLACFSMSED